MLRSHSSHPRKNHNADTVVVGKIPASPPHRNFSRILPVSVFILGFAVVGAILLYATHAASPTTNTCSRSAIDVPSCGVLWGAYVPNQQLTGLESQIGRQFDLFEQYNDFSTGTNGQIPNSADSSLMQGGRTLLATWQPRVYSASTNYSWSQIASGSLDSSVIIPQATRIKALGSTKVFLAFDSEMDDTSTHTAAAYGTPAQYVAAYQHIYNIFKAQGVTNVVWVWTPTGYSGYYGTLAQYYPGDAYVNWIGYDPYNFYQCNSGETTWKNPQTTFSGFYNWVSGGGLGAGAESKPMIMDEYGSHNDANDPIAGDSDWYAQIPAALTALPKLKGLLEFDSVGVCTTQITTAADVAGFKQAGLSSTVLGTGSTPPPAPAAPTATITSPKSGKVSGTISVNVSTADTNSTVTKVALLVDGRSVATDTSSPWSFSWNSASVANGSHSLEAVATNAAGGTGSSSAITVTVNNTAIAPAPGTIAPPTSTKASLKAPTGQSVVNTKVTGSATSGSLITLDPTDVTDSTKVKSILKVEFYNNNTLIQTIYKPPFALNTTGLKAGTYNLTQRTYYVDGSMSQQSQRITIKAKQTTAVRHPAKDHVWWMLLWVAAVLAIVAVTGTVALRCWPELRRWSRWFKRKP